MGDIRWGLGRPVDNVLMVQNLDTRLRGVLSKSVGTQINPCLRNVHVARQGSANSVTPISITA